MKVFNPTNDEILNKSVQRLKFALGVEGTLDSCDCSLVLLETFFSQYLFYLRVCVLCLYMCSVAKGAIPKGVRHLRHGRCAPT